MVKEVKEEYKNMSFENATRLCGGQQGKWDFVIPFISFSRKNNDPSRGTSNPM